MSASGFLSRLDQCEWLKHQHSALASAHDIAHKIAVEVRASLDAQFFDCGKCFWF